MKAQAARDMFYTGSCHCLFSRMDGNSLEVKRGQWYSFHMYWWRGSHWKRQQTKGFLFFYSFRDFFL